MDKFYLLDLIYKKTGVPNIWQSISGTGKGWLNDQIKLFESDDLEDWKINLLEQVNFPFKKVRYFFYSFRRIEILKLFYKRNEVAPTRCLAVARL